MVLLPQREDPRTPFPPDLFRGTIDETLEVSVQQIEIANGDTWFQVSSTLVG